MEAIYTEMGELTQGTAAQNPGTAQGQDTVSGQDSGQQNAGQDTGGGQQSAAQEAENADGTQAQG